MYDWFASGRKNDNEEMWKSWLHLTHFIQNIYILLKQTEPSLMKVIWTRLRRFLKTRIYRIGSTGDALVDQKVRKCKIACAMDQNKAVYTAISVACGWAGAVLSLCKPRNSEIRDQKLDDTDRPTIRWHRPTDRPTDIVTYRVASTRLKMRIGTSTFRVYS